MRNLPLLLAILFVAIALLLPADADGDNKYDHSKKCMELSDGLAIVKCMKEGVTECNNDISTQLKQCKDGYPTGALVALSLLFVLFLVLFVIVMVDALWLNKWFKRAKGGSDG